MVVLLASGEWVGELQKRLRQRSIVDISLVQSPLVAVHVASATPSAVMVLDMAIHNALEAVKKAQDLRPQTKLIAVSESQPDVETALALIGAVDYFLLSPSQNIPQLIQMVERNESVFTAADFRVDVANRMAEYNCHPLALSPVQFQILTVMVQTYNRPQSVTYQDLARIIHNEELTAKEAITKFKTHLHDLRQKLSEVMGRDPLKTRKGVVYWVNPR